MSVIVCKPGRAAHPYYMEGIGVNIYTCQELCYAIYHHMMLFLDGFLDNSLVDFIRDELGMGFLAARMEQRMKSGEKAEDPLFLFLQECDYYTTMEINRLRQTAASLRKLPPLEFAKKKADYLAELKQYGKAAAGYEEILEKADSKTDSQLTGRVLNNLGTCYARIFQFRKAMEAFDKAYGQKKDLRILEHMYHLTRLSPGLELRERYRSMVSKELMEQWNQDFEKAGEAAHKSEDVKNLEKLFDKEPDEREKEIGRLVEEWKQEYRGMG